MPARSSGGSARFPSAPGITYLVHGEPPAQQALKQRIERELGWNVRIPSYGERVTWRCNLCEDMTDLLRATDTRPYLLEQIDDAAVVQLYADGFAALPLSEKVLVWHLYCAAIEGRDIYYDQRYRHNLAMRASSKRSSRTRRAFRSRCWRRSLATRSSSG